MKISVKSDPIVVIEVDAATADLIRQLAYAVNWDQFPAAEELVDSLNNLDAIQDGDFPSIGYDSDDGQFNRID